MEEKRELLDQDLLNQVRDLLKQSQDLLAEDSPVEAPIKPSKIKHIVLSGGGTFGISSYGLLKRLNELGRWRIEDIKSIYGTSVGAMIATIVALNYDWPTIDNYLINRPWEKVFYFNMTTILNSYEKQGIFNIKMIEDMFAPLFGGKNIPINVSMLDFYKITNIDLHIITTEFQSLTTVDISHKTHPDWLVIEAIYSSACLPILCSPFLKDSKYYLDGGILCNYPLNNCINDQKSTIYQEKTPEDSDEIMDEISGEILGITRLKNEVDRVKLDEQATLLDYVFSLLYKLIDRKRFIPPVIKNEFKIDANPVSIYDIYLFSTSKEERLRLIEVGYNMAI
jgi:predicted acylesterase/phospholipase RssA